MSLLHSPLPAVHSMVAPTGLIEIIAKQWQPLGADNVGGLGANKVQVPWAHTTIWTVLLEHVENELEKYEPAHHVQTMLRDKTHKWRAMSALQKAIRRGNTLLAYKAGRAMLLGGAETDLWRRLAIIALEDIGLADPYQAAFASMFAGNKPIRVKLGQEKLLYWLLDKMCGAVKSRDLCDLITIAWDDPGCKAIGDDIAQWSEAQTLKMAGHCESTIMEKIWCYRHMWDRWRDRPVPAHPETLKHEFYDNIGLPPLLSFIAHQNIRGTNESLGCTIPVVWQLMCASQSFWADLDPFEAGSSDEDEIIGAVYGATYDKHTVEGKKAAKRFLTHVPEIAAATATYCPGYGPAALERAIFYVEGAILRPRLYFDKACDLYDEVLDVKAKWTGFKSMGDCKTYFAIVAQHLPKLNAIRKQILASS